MGAGKVEALIVQGANPAYGVPAWAGFAYEDVQKFYTLDEVGPVKGLGRELTTKDLLEAAAAASEGREPDVAPSSNVSPRDTFEPAAIRQDWKLRRQPPDFEAIKRGEVWEQLLGTPTNY